MSEDTFFENGNATSLSKLIVKYADGLVDSEYSDENKPAFRNGENRQTGIQDTALAA